jgi:hypothetical protein
VEQWQSKEQFAQRYYASEKVASQIAAVRKGLSINVAGSRAFHIWGPPGVGKTRLALEVVREALSLFTIYLPVYSPEVVTLLAQVRSDPGAHLIVVVDETPPEAVSSLFEQVRLAEGRVKLLTIGMSPPADNPRVELLEQKPLTSDVMRQVVKEQAPDLPAEHTAFVVRFADGYVKLARIVCDALADDPDVQGLKLLQENRDIGHLMRRLLGNLTDTVRRSLHVVALLSRVGWEGERAQEGQAVAACLGLNWLEVKHQVDQAHQQLAIAPLAGRLRYISPRPLALYLALEAMRSYRDELRKLPDQLPWESTREAFYSRLSELAEFPAALPWVREEIDRFFSLSDLDSDSSAHVWSNLALADPRHAAARIREILQRASPQEKQAFDKGRREVVWALVKLAWRRDTFEDAMLALAELAVAENEPFSNNATGEFCARFQIVLGGTEVPYRERLVVLDELVRRSEPARTRLVIQALSSAGLLHETRLCHGEDHGARCVNPEWHPDDREVIDARREAVTRLTHLARQGHAGLDEALVVATDTVLPLLTHGGIPDDVSELVKTVATQYPRHKEALRREVAQRLELLTPATDRIPQRILDTLSVLHDALVDRSLEGRLQQFVGRLRWDASGPPSDLVSLVEELFSHPDLLNQHFAWLTSGKAENVWEFGRLLGERDSEGVLLKQLTSRADRGPDLRLTCGYLACQAIHQPQGWLDDWLDSHLTVEPPDDELVLEVTWRLTANERGAGRIIELLRRAHLPPERFASLGYSNWTAVLEINTLSRLLAELVRYPKLRLTALTLLRQRLHRNAEDLQPLSELAAQLVTDPALVLEGRSPVWGEVASSLIPAHARAIARAILAAHASRNNGSLSFSPAATRLRQCAVQDPNGLWTELIPYLEDEEKARFFVSGFPAGIVDGLPHESLLEWAAVSPDRRASVLAHLADPDFTRDDSLAAKLADLFGDRETVSSALFAQLTTGAWNGSSSDHWATLAAQMEQVIHTTRAPGLRRWARRACEWLLGKEARDRVYEAERDLEITLR